MTTPRDLAALVREITEGVDRLRPPAREISATGAGAALARYRERLTSLADLQRELQELGYKGLEAARIVHQAMLERDREYRLTIRDLVERAFERGIIEEPSLRAELLDLGLGQGEVGLEISISALRRALREETRPPKPAPSSS